jgi:hypothetical protein
MSKKEEETEAGPRNFGVFLSNVDNGDAVIALSAEQHKLMCVLAAEAERIQGTVKGLADAEARLQGRAQRRRRRELLDRAQRACACARRVAVLHVEGQQPRRRKPASEKLPFDVARSNSEARDPLASNRKNGAPRRLKVENGNQKSRSRSRRGPRARVDRGAGHHVTDPKTQQVRPRAARAKTMAGARSSTSRSTATLRCVALARRSPRRPAASFRWCCATRTKTALSSRSATARPTSSLLAVIDYNKQRARTARRASVSTGFRTSFPISDEWAFWTSEEREGDAAGRVRRVHRVAHRGSR